MADLVERSAAWMARAVRSREVSALPACRRRADPAGRQAHAGDVRQRARPAGRDGAGHALRGGLPVGVQLFARRGEERTLVALAERLEAALGGRLEPGAA